MVMNVNPNPTRKAPAQKMAPHTAPKSPLSKAIVPVFMGVLALSFVVRAVDFYDDGRVFLSRETSFTFAKAVAQEQATPTATGAQPTAAESEGDESDMPPITSENDNVFAPPPSLPDRDFIEDADYSQSEIEVLQSLAKRREDLNKKEAALRQKEALLAAAEKQIETKMNELSALRSEIENLLGKQQQEQEARIASLVRMYETMKAKDAARIFDTLEMDVLIAVMGRMSERKAAPVLAEMDSEIARTVTIKLAEQKKLPEMPKDDGGVLSSPASSAAPAPATSSASPSAVPSLSPSLSPGATPGTMPSIAPATQAPSNPAQTPQQ